MADIPDNKPLILWANLGPDEHPRWVLVEAVAVSDVPGFVRCRTEKGELLTVEVGKLKRVK
jgi:hypothetical protein